MTERSVSFTCEPNLSYVNPIKVTDPDVVSRTSRCFADKVGSEYCVLVNSGTSALEIAIRALAISGRLPEKRYSDYNRRYTSEYCFAVPGFTFYGVANAVRNCGYEPLFIDVDYITMNMCSDYVCEAIEKGLVSGVVAVHSFGLPCDIERIVECAKEYDVPVIEDCCESLGATVNGKRVGTFGDIAVFSFTPTKLVTCGEGGAIVTNDAVLYFLCRALSDPGYARIYNSSYHKFDSCGPVISGNHRMPAVCAGILSGQIPFLGEIIELRRLLAEEYYSHLDGLGFELPVRDEGHVYNFFNIRVAGGREWRNRIVSGMRKSGVEARCYFDYTMEDVFRGAGVYSRYNVLATSELCADTVISLPIHSHMSSDDVEFVCDVLCDVSQRTRPVGGD